MSKVKQYSVERGFISKLIETKDFKLLKDLQIQPFFLTGENRRVFQYIQECFKTTGEVPTPRVIQQKFPSYELEYHDSEGGRVNFDDGYIFEMILLESFQAGLSWECVLNKREGFCAAFDNFSVIKIIKCGTKSFSFV